MEIKFLVQQFCAYSSYIRGFSPSTIRRYRLVVDLFAADSRIMQIEEVTLDMVRSWFFNGRTNRKWSAVTFSTYHKSLKVFFRWCAKEKFLHLDPISDIEIPRAEKKLPSKLTKQDALRLLEVVYNYPYRNSFERHRNHAVLATFLFAGLRHTELLNLKYADVDVLNLSIFIRQGKGSKDRIVPIPNSLAAILTKYIAERNNLGKTCPEFFASLKNNAAFPDMGLRHLIKQVSTISGIKFTAHKLRHTFATLMLEGGCDIYSLSKMMGHSDIKTTTIYLAASVEHLRSQISKHPLNLSGDGLDFQH